MRPVDSVCLVELTEDQAAMVAAWFKADAEARARFTLYDEHPRWWQLVEEEGARLGFIAWQGGEAVGFVDIELEGAEASLAVMVREDHRNAGLGRRLIALANEEARRLGANMLVGYVEPDNPSAIRASLAAGLELGDLDSDGMIPARTAIRSGAR
jgi:GNAT superfamily N-acetyltransferase